MKKQALYIIPILLFTSILLAADYSIKNQPDENVTSIDNRNSLKTTKILIR